MYRNVDKVLVYPFSQRHPISVPSVKGPEVCVMLQPKLGSKKNATVGKSIPKANPLPQLVNISINGRYSLDASRGTVTEGHVVVGFLGHGAHHLVVRVELCRNAGIEDGNKASNEDQECIVRQ